MNKLFGFTLLELMVVLAIMGVLVAVAVPTYQQYVRRARYSEIMLALAPYKLAVVECYQDTDNFALCNAGTHDIPPDIKNAEGMIASLAVTSGQIMVIPAENNGFHHTDTLIATPNATPSHRVVWTFSGGAVDKGYVST